MRWIANFERTMERWTGTAWSLMRKPKEKPAEVVAVLRQECDDNAVIVGRGRTLVPNHFTIELPHDSHRQLDAHSGQLAPHLAAQIRRYAAEQRYSFAGPVTIRLRAHPANDRVRYRVHSHIAPRHTPAPADDLTKDMPMPIVTGEEGTPAKPQD